MAQNTSNSGSGFSLPAPADSATPAVPTTTATVIMPPGEKFEGTYTVASDTASRDMLIGGGVLLVLLVAFFFARAAYANTLVGKRIPPSKANAAGWWLFILLGSLATGVVLATVNQAKFLTLLVTGPIAALALLCLVLMLLTGRR